MAIFTQGNNSCYFIHIPRTGGRHISSLFENSNNMICKYHIIDRYRFDGVDATHLQYPTYINLFVNVDIIPHITVVRNPYDKFNSCINNMHNIHGVDFNYMLTSYNSFLEFVNEEISERSYHNNWFLPQSKFISPKTHYWKYEWGFGEKFKKWIFDKTKIEIDLTKGEYEKFSGETKNNYKLNENIKEYVRKFYKEDYKRFNYL